MERDFLGGAIEKDRRAEDEGRTESSGYFGGGGSPAMDWSFASRADAAPALMSFRSSAREETGELPFLPAFDGVRKHQNSRVLTPQRSFGAERHGGLQYSALRSAYGGQLTPQQQQQQQHVLNGARVIPVSSPFNPNNPVFRVQSSPNLPSVVAGGGAFKHPPFFANNAAAGSTVGVYGTRDMPKPKASQLTIFYAGSVNVFNNVSAEKAQELMFLASRGSLPSAPNTVALNPNTPFPAPAKFAAPQVSPTKQMLLQKTQHVSPPVAAISRPTSIMSQAACLPRSASSSDIDSTKPNSPASLVVSPTSQAPSTHHTTIATTTAESIMPRAVPQARKASLARFMEKRKERVSTVAPYTSTKSPLDSSDTIGSANDNGKSSCTDITFSSNLDESLHLRQPRMNISFSVESPSTELQM